MEVVKKSSGGKIDELAEKVFIKSIEMVGGLKELVKYRNLTWLPSLAEAAYVIAMKEEAMKTHGEIARALGITEQTVRNIVSADEKEVEKYLRGEIEDLKGEHIAGALAKMAYKEIKKSDTGTG